MKAIQRIAVAACVLATSPLQAQMLEGWSAESIARAREECVQRSVAIAKEAYARLVASSGYPDRPVPEKTVRERSAATCECVVDKATTALPLSEWQSNFDASYASLLVEVFAQGQCKALAALPGGLGGLEGGTSRSLQEDFDRIRLDHAFVIAALVDEYRAKTGTYPFADGTDSVPTAVVIGTDEQRERNKELVRIRIDFALRSTNGDPAPRFERVEMRTMSEFVAELGRGLGRPVQVPVDPQQFPVNKPSVYTYALYRGVYDVSVFLHQEFSFARPLGPYYNKVAIASRSYPKSGFWTAEELKKEPQFIEFFRKPFNGARYTLKTKL